MGVKHAIALSFGNLILAVPRSPLFMHTHRIVLDRHRNKILHIKKKLEKLEFTWL